MDEGEEAPLITVGRYTVLTKIVSHTKYGMRANHLRSVFSGLDFIRFFFGYDFEEHFEPGAGRVRSGQRGLCHQV